MDSSLIGVINDLQAALSTAGSSLTFDLPQIAVIGNQSAGKSSVLENIVKKDFLPRGTGIVTRRPLVLQLVKDEFATREWAEFGHCPGKRFEDFNEVRAEIERETDRLTGKNKNISPWPINLRVHSASVLDLTLVDLPGMTKVPVGDQPTDIEKQIKDMLLTFITNQSCLILAVCPANADLATADAIKLAQEVDPNGDRTLGVLTKLDLMDECTDAKEMLQNKLIPLRYGWVGVVNRGQKDIMGNKDVNAALQDEMTFFSKHPAYSDMRHVLGTTYLCKMLNKHLTKHIAKNMPQLNKTLKDQMNQITHELRQIENDSKFNLDDELGKSTAVIHMTISFANFLRHEVLGGDSDKIVTLNKLNTAARMGHIFQDKYREMLLSTDITEESIMKKEIGYGIKNMMGINPGLFAPDRAFDMVIRTQLDKLAKPTYEFLDLVSEEMCNGMRIAVETLKTYPELASLIETHAHDIFLIQKEIAIEKTKTIMEIEKAYINTRHEDFVGFQKAGKKAFSTVMKRRVPGQTILTKGYLRLKEGKARKSYKPYFFALTPDSLTWYTDETENKKIYTMSLDEETLKFKLKRRDRKFAIYSVNETPICKSESIMHFLADDDIVCETWRKNFFQVGIFPDDETAVRKETPMSVSSHIMDCDDPWLERQIETIWILVNSYMSIACKRLTDIVPKCVVQAMIKNTVEKMETDLVADMSRMNNLDSLFGMSDIEKEKKDQLKKSLKACQFALDKLANVTRNMNGLIGL